MRIAYLSVDAPEWLAFIDQNPGTSPYHTPAWSSLIAECYGFRPFVLAAVTDGNTVRAGVPVLEVAHWGGKKRWVSLPFTDACPVLHQDSQAAGLLIEHLSDLCQGGELASAEVRGPCPEHKRVHARGRFVHHALPLCSDAQFVFKTFSPSRVGQKIRQASKRGVTVRFGNTSADLEIFYQLFVKTHHRLGVPVQPKLLFRLLQTKVIAKGLGYTLLAYKDATPIAGLVFLCFGKTVAAKYAASDPEFWTLRPNNLLYWEAIQWGCNQGFSAFDMGRTDEDDQNLREFKNGWGTVEEPLSYSVVSIRPPKESSGRLYRCLQPVLRGSPPWVCRALGQYFYKYAA
ncbi:MAG TPA: GNAT family N-acetyltransferase [Candidatus Paceibacterota bacterium]|nr:GNAT family N-acetyltransferase [Verrucomicrobiota bacterium]HSA10036.1 GNAT family N-acetyltransferase [Candidatus Paceibacterota bacterium]